MEYLGDKLSVAHSQVSGWMGNVRRSLQGALNLVSSSVERRSTGGGGEDGGGFKRAASLRSLANRSRESFRRFSLRSQQRLSLRRRTTSLASPSTPSSELVKQCVSGPEENKDTDNLVQETDSQYGTWETGLRTDDSLTPATPSSDDNLTPSPRKPTPPHTTEQPLLIDTTDGSTTSPQKQTELPFPETPTTLLDSSALRARVNLNKKSTRRAPPSRAARHSALLSQVPEAPEQRMNGATGTQQRIRQTLLSRARKSGTLPWHGPICSEGSAKEERRVRQSDRRPFTPSAHTLTQISFLASSCPCAASCWWQRERGRVLTSVAERTKD
ncbi:hypothetical protein QQF64_031884, partial [Cirrhinus molitorella]